METPTRLPRGADSPPVSRDPGNLDLTADWRVPGARNVVERGTTGNVVIAHFRRHFSTTTLSFMLYNLFPSSIGPLNFSFDFDLFKYK